MSVITFIKTNEMQASPAPQGAGLCFRGWACFRHSERNEEQRPEPIAVSCSGSYCHSERSEESRLKVPMRDPSVASSLRMTYPNCHSERSEEQRPEPIAGSCSGSYCHSERSEESRLKVPMRDPSVVYSLRMTYPNCHSERSEESRLKVQCEILRSPTPSG